MVINREFFFRGWLPAGLLINAKLVTTAPNTGQAVLKPVLNPLPGAGWRIDQPRPVFPVEQATSESAIVLADPLPDGTLALLPLGEWYGSGSPYLLGVNTWYEGRIRIVSGDDIMSVRLIAGSVRNYFSDNDDASVKDVAATMMACRHIVGKHTEQVLLPDPGEVTAPVMGWSPRISAGGDEAPARVMSKVALTSASFAGTRTIYAEGNPSANPIPFIQCTVADGKLVGEEPAYVGIVLRLDKGDQKFFYLGPDAIGVQVDDLNKSNRLIGTVAISEVADQVVHYN